MRNAYNLLYNDVLCYYQYHILPSLITSNKVPRIDNYITIFRKKFEVFATNLSSIRSIHYETVSCNLPYDVFYLLNHLVNHFSLRAFFLRELLLHNATSLKAVGDIVKNTKYANSLRKVAQNYDAINNGSLTESFLKDLNEAGGNMTKEDLQNYTVLVKDTVKNSLGGGLTLHTTPLPGGGSVLTHILNIAEGIY